MQPDTAGRLRLHRATSVLTLSSWSMVALFGLSAVLSVPPIAATLSGAPPGSLMDIAASALLVYLGVNAFALWGSAVAHSVLRPDQRRVRGAVVAALIVTNVLGALVYFFVSVRGRQQ